MASTGAGRAEDTRQPWHASTPAASLSRAARLLALLLGHEARITDEQWEDVRAMDDLCAICGIAPRNPLANICQSCSDKVEQTRARLISERQITHHCPACEAAARELADLRALCDKQAALLSAVAVALRGPEPPLTRWSHADLPERAAAVVRERDDLRARFTAAIDELRGMSDVMKAEQVCLNTAAAIDERVGELIGNDFHPDDLRARIEARLAFCEGSIEHGGIIRTADEARWLRALLAEKEAK